MEDILLQPDQITDDFAIPSMESLSMVEFKAGKVDLQNRTISSVIICQTGEARGHGVNLEQEFLTDMLNFINKSMDGQVRSNFNHNYDNMGLQLGRFHSVRLSGTKIIAELNVFNAADDSPRMPGMGSYVMKLAQEDSKALACSIRFQPSFYYQYDEENKKVKMKHYSWYERKFENQDIKKKLFVAFGKLISADLVAEGAVTDSLFHKILTMSETTKPAAEDTAEVTALREQITSLQAEITALKAGTKPAAADAAPAAETASATQDFSALTAKIEDLEKQIKVLSKQPADTHTSGKSKEEAPDAPQKYSSVTEKAIAYYDRRQQNK
jgi:polyhydroxyalkanoate synthesis regulator phasin